VAWIEEITVDQDVRRHGLSAALTAEFERWAAARGCALVALATRRPAPFYVALGYEASATYFRRLL
jgi:GNAT superfamily N-acetyltransferase